MSLTQLQHCARRSPAQSPHKCSVVLAVIARNNLIYDTVRLGNHGEEVTAVLGNAQGGLELLPSEAYGNDWLQVHRNRNTLLSLPKDGDPYEEIYKLRGKWYGLLREEWINPAGLPPKASGFERTCRLLDNAKRFHADIANTYHDQSYAHYGADPTHAAWHRVVWNVGGYSGTQDISALAIQSDDQQGYMIMSGPKEATPHQVAPTVGVRMMPASDAGDQTVPLHSAEHQLRSGKFRGIFRQRGYEHQDSYKNPAALHSTLYSLVRIAQTMAWES